MTVEIADLGSFFGDDKIMTLEGSEGLGVFKPGQREKKDGKQLVYVDRLVEGPHFWVGPFFIPADRDGPFTISVPADKMRKPGAYRKFAGWSLGQAFKLSKKKYSSGAVPGQNARMWVKKDGAYWGTPNVLNTNFLPRLSTRETNPSRCEPRLLGACIPKNEFVAPEFITGKSPIFRYDHPTKKRSGGSPEKWAVFMTIIDESSAGSAYGQAAAGGPVNLRGSHYRFTFKKVTPSFWGRLWDWLKSIVIKLVETVVDLLKSLIESLIKYACSLAKPLLIEIQNSAKQKTALPASTREKIAKSNIGISADTIDTLIAGGTVAGVREVGNAVVGALCGVEEATGGGVPETEDEKLSPLVVAGGLTIGGVIVYLLFV